MVNNTHNTKNKTLSQPHPKKKKKKKNLKNFIVKHFCYVPFEGKKEMGFAKKERFGVVDSKRRYPQCLESHLILIIFIPFKMGEKLSLHFPFNGERYTPWVQGL